MADTPQFTSINEEAAAPKPGEVVYFGRTDFRNANRLFGIQRKDRRQHLYVIGQTGTGKSSLLQNMIIQDIVNGEGLCVVDPHGELIEETLEKIPKHRASDVVYFNPADTEFPVGFNVLELPDVRYKHLVASGLMGIFTKIWANVWSARMEYILSNAVLALLDTPHTTLLGIPRMLVDKDYRQIIVNNLKNPIVRAFWVNEYEEWEDKYRKEAIAAIQNKVGQFLSTTIVRNVVGQGKSTIDIYKLMNERKILLINVSKGRIGEDNSALLGAMFITKIQLAAMERVRIPEEERQDFYLYVDEFQNFATDSFANILSEARKYRLNLIMAHQYIGQLMTDTSTAVRDAVFGNVGTMIAFRVGATDAEFLEKEFEPEFMIQDMVNLPNYRVYLKLMIDGMRTRPFSAKTLPKFKINTEAAPISEVVELSRKQYASSRAEVERGINSWSGMMGQVDSSAVGSAVEFAGTGAGAGITKGQVVLGKDGKTPMYPVACSNCGRETHVPFKPTPGRPVYCNDCLEKIKSGELKVMSAGELEREASRKEESIDALAAIGIEFENKKTPRAPTGTLAPRPSLGERPMVSREVRRAAPAPIPNSASRGVVPPPIAASKSVVNPPVKSAQSLMEDGFISLKDLKPSFESAPQPRSEEKSKAEVDELRSMIKETLQKKD